jgi:hypothetical protein
MKIVEQLAAASTPKKTLQEERPTGPKCDANRSTAWKYGHRLSDAVLFGGGLGSDDDDDTVPSLDSGKSQQVSRSTLPKADSVFTSKSGDATLSIPRTLLQQWQQEMPALSQNRKKLENTDVATDIASVTSAQAQD